MVFNPNIPQPTDDLSDSQPILLTNNQDLDTSFGIDHYAFSNATVNNGFHNKVTQPLIVGAAHPTTTTNPILYAMQDTANIGVIQYSRGPSDAVPTPITELQSPSAGFSMTAASTSNILDFTGITKSCMCSLYASSHNGATYGILESLIYWFWNGASGSFVKTNIFSTGQLVSSTSGNILQILSGPALTEVRWTLRFHRIQLT